MIEFVLYCNPPKHTTQGSSTILKNFKTGKYFIGKKSNSNATQSKNYLLAMLMPHRPKTPLQGALKCEIDIFYSWRKSETKKNMAKGVMWNDVRPDIDNLNKLILDCLTTLGFWKDDSQVAILKTSKSWCDVPRIEFKIEELNK